MPKVPSNITEDRQRPENEHHIKEVEKGGKRKKKKKLLQTFFSKLRFCTSVVAVAFVVVVVMGRKCVAISH